MKIDHRHIVIAITRLGDRDVALRTKIDVSFYRRFNSGGNAFTVFHFAFPVHPVRTCRQALDSLFGMVATPCLAGVLVNYRRWLFVRQAPRRSWLAMLAAALTMVRRVAQANARRDGMIAGIGYSPIPFYTDRWHISGMNTDNDSPCSAADRAAIIAAARYRAGFIRWLSTLLSDPRWDRMAPQGQDAVRAEVRMVLEQMTEGCS